MTTEFKIRTVTRYIITSHDESGTHTIAQVENEQSAKQILHALTTAESVGNTYDHLEWYDFEYDKDLTQVRNALTDAGYPTVGHVRRATADDLLAVKGFGKGALQQTIEMMKPYGGIRP